MRILRRLFQIIGILLMLWIAGSMLGLPGIIIAGIAIYEDPRAWGL